MGKCTAVAIKDGGGQAEGVPVRDFVLVQYGQTVRDILQRFLSSNFSQITLLDLEAAHQLGLHPLADTPGPRRQL